jgi:hypothetical protein
LGFLEFPIYENQPILTKRAEIGGFLRLFEKIDLKISNFWDFWPNSVDFKRFLGFFWV